MAPGDPKRCVKCGYDLTGLPGVGECPECGAVFNMFTGEGVKTPGTQSSETERAMRMVKVVCGIAAALFIVLCSGVFQLFITHRQVVILGCVLALIPLMWALTNYLDDKS